MKGCVCKMGQNLWKKMYNGIHLNPEQKSKIWFNIESENSRANHKRKYRFSPIFTICCHCMILAARIPAVAAGTGVLDKIIHAFNLISGENQPLTKEQKDIYEQHINALDIEIMLKNGTLKLNSVLCDGTCICIPFTTRLADRIAIDGNRFSAATIQNTLLGETSTLEFFTSDSNSITSCNTVLDDITPKKNTITGCYLLYESDRELREGDVIQVRRKAKDENTATGILGELTLQKTLQRQTIPADMVQPKLRKGDSIDKITLSPISLKITGTEKEKGSRRSIYLSEIALKLKDGNTIQQSNSYSSKGSDEKTGYYFYESIILFNAPVNSDDVLGIQIQNEALDLWIPVNHKK